MVAFAALLGVLFLVGILNWILIGGGLLVIGYVIYLLGSVRNRNALSGHDRSLRKLDRQLKKLNKRE